MHRADRRDRERADRQQQQLPGQPKIADGARAEHGADRPGRDIGAERIQLTVRKVDDAHDAVNQAQARGNEEKNGRVENGIQNLNYQNVHCPPVDFSCCLILDAGEAARARDGHFLSIMFTPADGRLDARKWSALHGFPSGKCRE